MKKKILISAAVGFLGIVCVGCVVMVSAINALVSIGNMCDSPMHRLVQSSGGMTKAEFTGLIKQQKLDVNEPCGDDRSTPLHEAVGEHPSVIPYLVELGANPNVKNAYGVTPLHWAVQWGDLKKVKILLKAGANPREPDNDGQSPLDVCIHETATDPNYPRQMAQILQSYSSKP